MNPILLMLILSGFTYNGHQLLNATSVFLDSHDICKSCLCSSGGTCSSNADPPITSTVCKCQPNVTRQKHVINANVQPHRLMQSLSLSI